MKILALKSFTEGEILLRMTGLKKIGLSLLCFVVLVLADDNYDANPYYVNPESVKRDMYKWTMNLSNHRAPSQNANNQEIMVAAVTFESLDERVLRFKMTDALNSRWEVKLENPKIGSDYHKVPIETMGLTLEEDPFGFAIIDPKTKERVISTVKGTNSSLKFHDKYIEYGIRLPNNRLFGLGERVTPQFELCPDRDWCVYTTLNKDENSPVDKGESPGGMQVYGHHPFFMMQLKSSLFIGMLFLNSNDQDTLIIKRPAGEINIYFKPIGGIIDSYVFYPDTAEGVMRKYHSLIGRPYVPPFWTLGFHQCRWGWQSLQAVQEVVSRYEESDIPLEVIWSDIDYMKDFADFSVDPVRYAGLGEFVKILHSRAIKWVPIIDAGLKYDKDDIYFKKGEQHGAFIKSAVSKQTLVGKVWPGFAVFPDWMNPYSKTLWHEGLDDLHNLAEFDGIWIDMNEVSNFCNGECTPTNPERIIHKLRDPNAQILDEEIAHSDPHDPLEFENLPYLPGNKDPNEKAISMSAYHRATNEYEDKFYKEYNLHSLWALYEAKATHTYFTEKLKKRPFVLTRASFPGSGMFTSKWLGDNFSSWEYLKFSIVGMYNFQMYGIPLIGADICGFLFDTNEELCARWMQMGAFYPFSRNHNEIHSQSQEPYLWEKVATAGRNAIRQKYSILLYYYTKLFEVSLYGGSLVRPLFFEFPHDEKAYTETESTFMIGPSLLVAPVLQANKQRVAPYVPNEHWYDLFNRQRLHEYNQGSTEGKQLDLNAGYDYINVLLKGGSIIPFQDAVTAKVRRTEFLKVMPMEMIVALDHKGEAKGSMIVDEGDSVDPIERKEYRHLTLEFSAATKKLHVIKLNDYQPIHQYEKFWKLSILGAEQLSTTSSACIIDINGQRTSLIPTYIQDKKVLSFTKQTSIPWGSISTIELDSNC